jgi:hypothetical protein
MASDTGMHTSACLTLGRTLWKLALAGLFLLASRPRYAYAPLLGRTPRQ